MKVVQGAAWARLRLSSGADGRAGTPNTADEPSTQAILRRRRPLAALRSCLPGLRPRFDATLCHRFTQISPNMVKRNGKTRARKPLVTPSLGGTRGSEGHYCLLSVRRKTTGTLLPGAACMQRTPSQETRLQCGGQAWRSHSSDAPRRLALQMLRQQHTSVGDRCGRSRIMMSCPPLPTLALGRSSTFHRASRRVSRASARDRLFG